jgi:hypothetical protein
VRQVLRQRLPEAMVPALVVWLERLPLSPNGKVDRAQLPSAIFGERAPADRPNSALEEAILVIWSEVLGHLVSDPLASFFDVGGNSLLLAKVRVRIEERLQVPVSMVELFRSFTPRALAHALTDGGEKAQVLAPSAEPQSDRNALAAQARERRQRRRSPGKGK